MRRPLTVAAASLVVGLGVFGGLACGGGSEAGSPTPVSSAADAIPVMKALHPVGEGN